MAYTPTTWVEKVTTVGPTNLNHLELGVQATAVVADAAIPKPAAPATSDALIWTGAAWANVKPPGYEFGSYTQITAQVLIAAATEAAPVTVITLPATTFDGATAVFIEVGCSLNLGNLAATIVGVSLWEGAADLGRFGIGQDNAAAQAIVPFTQKIRITPSAAAHTYLIRAWATANANTGFIAGTGGVGANSPAYARIFKA